MTCNLGHHHHNYNVTVIIINIFLSLLIKLFAVAVLAAAAFVDHRSPIPLALLLVLWLQDAIWKTFQSRIEVRLLQLETHLASGEANDGDAFQYNRLFADNRPGVTGLVQDYLQQAARPTVAFPHLLLVCIAVTML